MEALNAVGITPLSVLSKTSDPRKSPSLLPQPARNQNQTLSLSRSFHGGLLLISSFLTSGISRALTYEEALRQSVDTATSSTSDFNGLLDSAIGFASENPVVIGGGLAVLAVPVVVGRILGKPKAWGVESAKSAYARLGDDENAQLLDLRSTAEIKQGGTPDIRGLKKKSVGIVYDGENKTGFLDKLSLKFKEPQNTTLLVLDKFDGNSELVAELVTANGFKAAYAIKDGAEGPKGWKNSGLPWLAPKKGLSFDLSSFTDAFGETSSDFVPLTLGVAAAAGLGLLAFTEVETILQVLGSAALIQFVSKKVLFAEDRKQTIQQLEEILNTKVAPNELVGDIQQIGKAFLPTISTSKALPAPAEVSPSPTDNSVLKSESTTELEVKPAAESTPEVHSVPTAEVQKESVSEVRSSLSPYPNYPDYKPPSSPIPSRP